MLKHLISDFCRETGAVIQKKAGINSFRAGFIDSRQMEKGGAFFVLPGEKTHGCKFVGSAVKNGAGVVISDREISGLAGRFCVLLHKSPLTALQSYATWCRQQYSGPVFGVTGSFGKTSTKDFLGGVLRGRGYVSEGNLNNTIGLPLCLLRLSSRHDFAVFEAGISKPGEMSLLAGMLRPNIAVVTGIGCSHREFFKTRSALVSEKLSLTENMDKDSFLFIPANLYRQFGAPASYEGQVRLLPEFSLSAGDVLPPELSFWTEADNLRFTGIFGAGPVQSLQRAVFVAREMGLLRRSFRSILQNLRLSSLRMERRSVHGRNFILDCYNACPESMRAFLESVYEMGRVTIVLGDMLELGDNSMVEHRSILEGIDFSRVDSVFVLGDFFSRCVREGNFTAVRVLQDKEELKKCLRNSDSDTFAFKGSRGFSLETVAEDLQREGF
jgi:UDP-N-acetylmuramoyl-tripeptide--D-alanyl-D-alanine ligase